MHHVVTIPSIADMMTDNVGMEDMSLTQPFPCLDDKVMEVTPTTKKASKDVALVMSWESVSLDPIVGTE